MNNKNEFLQQAIQYAILYQFSFIDAYVSSNWFEDDASEEDKKYIKEAEDWIREAYDYAYNRWKIKLDTGGVSVDNLKKIDKNCKS